MMSFGESASPIDGEQTEIRPGVSRPSARALGQHLIAEFYGASQLFDPEPSRSVLREAAQACGATVLDVHLHDFGARAGFTGVALLAESHISLHSWPEHDYLAVDVFVCGGVDPRPAVDVLRRHFQPTDCTVKVFERGEPASLRPSACPSA